MSGAHERKGQTDGFAIANTGTSRSPVRVQYALYTIYTVSQKTLTFLFF